MPLLEIIVSEIRGGWFAATLDGERIATSRTPLLSSARALLKRGVPPETPIAMRHFKSCFMALTSTVGAAAGLRVDVERTRFAPYRPPPNARGEAQDGICEEVST